MYIYNVHILQCTLRLNLCPAVIYVLPLCLKLWESFFQQLDEKYK